MLKSISLQNFRGYEKSEFNFNTATTLIVGPNTSGKTNLVEAIFLLSTGKSFRTDKDTEMLSYKKNLARVKGKLDDLDLEVLLTGGEVNGKKTQFKKFLINGVPKRRVDFEGNLLSVLFSPEDLDIIVDSPSLRRKFLDNVLEQVDRDYRLASISYTKALRQRNALLETARETGARNEKQFEYWDNIVIENGGTITQKREEFIAYVNTASKDIFDFAAFYDKSIISKQRLLQYKEQELGAGVTLVGPHRDDFSLSMYNNTRLTTHDIKAFGSRGQQRLAILQLKFLEIDYIEKILGKRPVLILDDIFSELDKNHIELVLEIIEFQQTIITTTHKEFIPLSILKKMHVITFTKEK